MTEQPKVDMKMQDEELYPLDASTLEKHSVTLSGHRTSVSLERIFWHHLRRLASLEQLSVAELIRRIDEARTGSLSGALRVYVMNALENEITAIKQDNSPQ